MRCELCCYESKNVTEFIEAKHEGEELVYCEVCWEEMQEDEKEDFDTIYHH